MKRTNGHIGIVLLLTAGLLAGCAGSGDEPTTVSENTPKEIRLTPNVWRVMDGTRATTISSNTELQDYALRIDAYLNGTTAECLSSAKLVYDGGWRFDDGSGNAVHHYWPIEGSVHTASGETVGSIDFVGYCPYVTPAYISSMSYVVGNPSFVCDVSWDAQNGATEFMWAYTGNQTKSTNSGTVNMAFKHPFARVKFQLAASHPDITVETITFKALKSGGTCSFNGMASTWSTLTPADKTVDLVATINQDCFSNPASEVSLGDDFLVVPQEFGGAITVKAKWIDWGEQISHNVSTTIPPVTWQAGYSYTYTFSITEKDLIVNITKFTEQW